MATECEPKVSKRPRLENEGIKNGSCVDQSSPEGESSESESLKLLRTLKLSRVLSNRSYDKFIAILAQHSEDKTDALLLLEKTPFPSELSNFDIEASSWVSSAEEVMQNDVYYKLNLEAKAYVGLSGLKATIIHPTTPRQIAKYEEQTVHLLHETPELYEKVVRPYVEKTRLSLNWVYNIINGTAEQDRVIFSDEDLDTGFILSMDLKWDGRTPEDMYCLALVRQADLTSLRDLRGEKHLPLLRNIANKGRKVLVERLGISASQLRIYFHYPPSFYHLHVHFTYAGTPVPGAEVERAHLLDTVINNLEMMPNYYQHSVLTVGVREKDTLYNLMVPESDNSNCEK